MLSTRQTPFVPLSPSPWSLEPGLLLDEGFGSHADVPSSLQDVAQGQQQMARPGPRVPKRPSSNGELDSGEEDDAPRPKRGPAEPDFSGIVRNKLHQYTRTGQACDRCKVRKIRCDALPEGCSHCLNQSLDCYVTDRVTGRTERRGYLQQLEREKKDMQAHIHGLERLLHGTGIHTRPWTWSAFPQPLPPDVAFDELGNAYSDPDSKDRWSQVNGVWVKNYGRAMTESRPSRTSPTKPTYVNSRPTNGFLGFGAGSPTQGSIGGTKLSILGTTIDVTTFDSRDDETSSQDALPGAPIYDKSVISLVRSVTNRNPPPDNVDLPSRQDAFTYSEWFFLMVQPFLPSLHKPSFMSLLTRIYDDPTATPSIPEVVIVHMVFASIYYQYGVRNREDPEKQAQLQDLANKHYHWSLTKFGDLAASTSVAAVQALIMLAQYTRNFPKPDCSTIVSNFTFNKAIGIGLHRAYRPAGQPTNLENEIRKRTWWTVCALVTTLRGRLGWPMAITPEEYDTEFPLNIPDECITDAGITEPSRIGSSPYAVGFSGFRISTIYMEFYTKLCCVRPDPARYVSTVRELEDKIRLFRAELPDQLVPGKTHAQAGNPLFALYTEAYTVEFELLLRHPSLCMTEDAEFKSENFRLSEIAADRLHKVVKRICELKSLDTTWYQLSVYVGAMFTTLMVNWERRMDATPKDLEALRAQMSSWLLIFSEIGTSLGSGPRLPNTLGHIVSRTIAEIERDMGRGLKTKSETRVDVKSEMQGQRSNSMNPTQANTFYDGATSVPPAAPYPANVAYGMPAAQEPSAFTPADRFAFSPGSTSQSILDTPLGTPSHASATAHPLITFAAQAAQQMSPAVPPPRASDAWQGTTAGNAWHDWAAVMAVPDQNGGGEQPHQFGNAASTLLTLAGGPGRPAIAGMAPPAVTMQEQAGSGLDVASMANHHAGQWPLLLFNDGNNAGSGG